MTIQQAIENEIPPGWLYSIYGPCENFRARCVLISPDYKIQIGREADSVDDAVKAAVKAAKRGEKQ